MQISTYTPAWGVTARHISPLLRSRRFNTRTPCGERWQGRSAGQVSTHTPRAECDSASDFCMTTHRFQHTHSVWGATKENTNALFANRSFNTRTPYGARPPCLHLIKMGSTFQHTHPVRGATGGGGSGDWGFEFQHTHPVRDATRMVRPATTTFTSFNTHTHPVRDATTPCPLVSSSVASFNTHIPCGMRLFWYGRPDIHYKKVSTHAPRAGCDL